MGRADFWKDGDWNSICDQCGYKYKASQLKLQWNGLRTCCRCFDLRNPQDFVKGVQDVQQTPFTRPDTPPSFVPVAVAEPDTTPTAAFSYSAVYNTITFTDLSTEVSDTSLVTWSWDFGDGSTSTLQNPVHIYTNAGNYTITLKVTNVYGSDTTSQDIDVQVLFLLDTFTGSGNLSTHIGETGAVWTSQSGQPLTWFPLSGGQVTLNQLATSGYVSASGTPSGLNYSMEATVTFQDWTASLSEIPITYLFGVDDFNNFFGFELDITGQDLGSGKKIYLSLYTDNGSGGTSTTLVDTGMVAGVAFTAKVIVDTTGTIVTAYINDVQLAQTILSPGLPQATLVGMALGNPTDAASIVSFSSIQGIG
jgi:PKD repeat protein